MKKIDKLKKEVEALSADYNERCNMKKLEGQKRWYQGERCSCFPLLKFINIHETNCVAHSVWWD